MRVTSIFILSDLEGAYSVKRFSETRKKGPEFDRARQLHTEQLNVMIKSIREFDHSIKIHIWDSHGCGGIDSATLADVEMFIPQGKLNLINYLTENNIDSLFFESAHAMSLTPHANLCHTMSSRTVKRYILNNSEIGELGLRAAVAGAVNVPVFYCNGDDKACIEAKKIMPWVLTTETKKSIGLQLTQELPREKVFDAISRDVKNSLFAAESMRPYIISNPINLHIQFKWYYTVFRLLKSLLILDTIPKNRFIVSNIKILAAKGVL